VTDTVVGYTGGTSPSPTYESVCSGDGHTEALQIEFDPAEVSYEDLLNKFIDSHYPVCHNPQYKLAVWYHNEEQQQSVESVMADKPHVYQKGIDVAPATSWYDAEEFHQKYYLKH